MPEEKTDQPEPADPTTEPTLEFVGNLFTHLPETPNQPEWDHDLARGRLFWAGGEYLRPGLYLWTGTRHLLLIGRNDLLDRLVNADHNDKYAEGEDPITHPLTKEEWIEQWEEQHPDHERHG